MAMMEGGGACSKGGKGLERGNRVQKREEDGGRRAEERRGGEEEQRRE